MSLIDKLIVKLCPKGVEFKPLGDIAELVRGNGMPKSDFTDSGVGCIHYGQIYTHYGIAATETISFVAPQTASSLAKVDPGDIIITNTSENLEDVCKSVAWLGKSQIVTGGHATVIKHNQNARFLSYYFRTPKFFAQKKKHAVGTKVIDVSAKSLGKIRVPVPPLEIQREIVKVLDTFSALEAELEAELEARRKQYRHYRDALLTFDDASTKRERVRCAALKELGVFTRGRRFTNKDFAESGIPCIHYGEVYTHYGLSATETKSFVRPELAPSLRMAKTGDLIIAGTGENVQDIGKAVAWLGKSDVAVHDDCYIFSHSLNPKYAAYFFQSSLFNEQKVKYAAGAKMIRIQSEGLQKIQIPVPGLKEQARIVSILDKFDALTNDLSMGLPAEIAARRQQYEHYRDRLLTFKEDA